VNAGEGAIAAARARPASADPRRLDIVFSLTEQDDSIAHGGQGLKRGLKGPALRATARKMSNVYRYARPEDQPALRRLIEDAYRSPHTAGRWDSESHLLTGPRTSDAELAHLLGDPDSRFIVADDGETCSACALIRREADGAYFGMFAVAERLRGKGTGRSLLHEAEERVWELWRAPRLRLTVISLREALIAWYERRGYARTGMRHRFPFETAAGALRRDFDLVEMEKRTAGR